MKWKLKRLICLQQKKNESYDQKKKRKYEKTKKNENVVHVVQNQIYKRRTISHNDHWNYDFKNE